MTSLGSAWTRHVPMCESGPCRDWYCSAPTRRQHVGVVDVAIPVSRPLIRHGRWRMMDALFACRWARMRTKLSAGHFVEMADVAAKKRKSRFWSIVRHPFQAEKWRMIGNQRAQLAHGVAPCCRTANLPADLPRRDAATFLGLQSSWLRGKKKRRNRI